MTRDRYTLWLESADRKLDDQILGSGLTLTEAAKFIREYECANVRFESGLYAEDIAVELIAGLERRPHLRRDFLERSLRVCAVNTDMIAPIPVDAITGANALKQRAHLACQPHGRRFRIRRWDPIGGMPVIPVHQHVAETIVDACRVLRAEQ
jgi:hypothetical protein